MAAGARTNRTGQVKELLSENTKAILLLTAPLNAGGRKRSSEVLKPGEYDRLARRIHELGKQPADLLTAERQSLLDECQLTIDALRIERLLGRGFQLSQAVEHWHARSIWVVSRAESDYPRRLKDRLKYRSPTVLYGCGESEILDLGGLAVAGSRHVDEELIEYTRGVSSLAAAAGCPVVSGGARGIDQAAMGGALEAGGRVSGVLADGLEKAAMRREHRNMILEGHLVLVSPYDPSAGFNVGHAMQRNKLIYALADAALVVNADLNKGGTWAGAVEQLDKLHFVPVFVRSTGQSSKGLDGLARKGAFSWPNPSDPDAFKATLNSAEVSQPEGPVQSELSFDEQLEAPRTVHVREPQPDQPKAVANTIAGSEPPAAEKLFDEVRELACRLLVEPLSNDEIAKALAVTKGQAQDWLRRLVSEGVVDKRTKPVRYVVRKEGPPK